jgi:hypothetical protein
MFSAASADNVYSGEAEEFGFGFWKYIALLNRKRL